PVTGTRDPTCATVAQGDLAFAQSVESLPAGLYRLVLEVPQNRGAPLRTEAWVPFWRWEAQRYRIRSQALSDWEALAPTNYPPQRALDSPVLVKGLNLYLGPGGARYNFGIVATARATLPAGTYRFSATSDDGVRVSVDGQFVTGQWVGRPPRTDTAVISLTG